MIPTHFALNNHKRYENGVWTGKNNFGAYRGFLFEKVNDEIYQVSMHILDGSMSNFGDYVQMESKPMKIISQTENKIVLRGFGYDVFGTFTAKIYNEYTILFHIRIFYDNNDENIL